MWCDAFGEDQKSCFMYHSLDFARVENVFNCSFEEILKIRSFAINLYFVKEEWSSCEHSSLEDLSIGGPPQSQ